MFLLIIILSYLLGCASTIALLLYLYTRYVVYSPVVINEQQEEQYQTFNPLPENERGKNSAVDAVNYLFQFLFQELKDSSRLRRYLMHKLNTEFKELKNSRTAKIFLQNIVIENFSIGKECPVFSDIQLERQERDERHLIKGFVAKLDVDYKDGFSVTLDITLLFGHKCRLSIKVNRIQGHLRLEFRREPFCHWLCVFQDEPFIDFQVKSYFATVESPQLAQLITQQLRRAIKRKQTWPSYKIRCQPFFATSKQSIPTEVLSTNGNNIIPGTFDITIKYCDRLSIPLAIFDKQKVSSVNVFLTININEQMCADYLHINRDQWKRKEIELKRNVNKLIVKEVNYMDRIEFLIDELDPLPNGIDDVTTLKAALEDKNVFLLKMQGQDITTLKQIHRLLKHRTTIPSNDGLTSTSTSTNATTTTTTTIIGGNEDKIQIVVGIPILHSVRVQRAAETSNTTETEKPASTSPTLSTRSENLASLTPPITVRQRIIPPTASVKFDKSADSIGLPVKSQDNEEEQSQNNSTPELSRKHPDVNIPKKSKHSKTSANDITLIMMNTDILQEFHAQPTATRKAEPYIEFDSKFDFQVGPNEQYLNICLWCKPPLDCDVPNPGKKLILLGYATVALSEIVLDAHMSYKRETQVTLNFRSAYSPKPNFKKRLELSSHKGYDENLANGFITINIKHKPEIEAKLNPQEKKEQFTVNAPILHDISTKLKEDERKQDQLKYINVINEEQELPTRKPTDHIFDDKTFTTSTLCSSCGKKIWMKSGRQCRDCLMTIHKKCEEKFSADTICTHDPNHVKTHPISTTSDDDLKNLVNIEISDSSIPPPNILMDNIESISIKSTPDIILTSNPNNNNRSTLAATTTTPATPTTTPTTTTTAANRLSTKAAAAFSALDSTARRSFRGAFGNKNSNQTTTNLVPSLSATSELSKSDESLSSSSPLPTKKPITTNVPVHAPSKIASAASSAYSKIREFKSKRLPATQETNPVKKTRSPSDSEPNETNPEADLRQIITQYLLDENNDVQGLEHLLHEKSVDDTIIYAKAQEFGQELYPELTPEERKQKIDSEISRLQHELDLNSHIRGEMLHEYQNVETDENEKRKLREKIANIDEKTQALGALTIFYCSGLKHCRTQMVAKEDESTKSISELPEEDENNEFYDNVEEHS
ncbi:unnamed protein product [Adineta steineri]|uniref:Phorbol-ester/DAG-type domain-containing protein n=1 Tax=Adineta steineri TaxID=433720 RepID=A0A818QEV7_9BILA|nr:unnamed protein product [Adineta steineri]